MGAGLPIVTTRSRGAPDHLVEGEHVLFTPPHDPEALAERLVLTLADDELNRRLRDANREKIRSSTPTVSPRTISPRSRRSWPGRPARGDARLALHGPHDADVQQIARLDTRRAITGGRRRPSRRRAGSLARLRARGRIAKGRDRCLDSQDARQGCAASRRSRGRSARDRRSRRGQRPDQRRDNVRPSTPFGLRVHSSGGSTILAWEPSTDNRRVVAYDVRFGSRWSRVVAPELRLRGVSCGRVATARVVAIDQARNRSRPATATVHVPGCSDSTPGWFGGFETGDLSEWDHLHASAPERFQIVRSDGAVMSRQGQFMARVEVRGKSPRLGRGARTSRRSRKEAIAN